MKTNWIVLICVTVAASFGPLGLRAGDAGAAPLVVKIRAGVDNLVKFDITSITATPGELIKVVLTNASALPKAVMGHDWILLTAGSDPAAFAAAAVKEPEHGYIPAALKGEIVAYISLLGPGETGQVTFKAPTEPGQYPFLCSFPGHYAVGMKGVLAVKR